MVDATRFVTAVGASLSEDGQASQLDFQRADGTVAYVQFPTVSAAGMLLNIEQALGKLFLMQQQLLKGEDPRTFFGIGVRRVSTIQGAMSTEGIPIVSLVLDTGVRLDLALEKKQIPELIEWMEGLAEVPASTPQSRN